MRRPADLAREAPAPRTPRPESLPSWPHGFASSSADREALLILSGLATLTARKLLELAVEHPTAAACLAAVRRGRSGSAGDRERAVATDPELVRSALRAADARMVAIGDPEYPESLLDLFDPPAVLFVRGRSLASLTPRVAIVGARNCSESGCDVATGLGLALARAGVGVVSGGARGIDSAAHRGALAGGGRSVCVLGCGIDLVYPASNRELIDDVATSGAVVSEYPPGIRAEPFRFPARNRIVAGLSRCVVVVEGAAGSGSMITADHALDLGREVFGVPGPVWSSLSQVPLELIREGATLIRGPDDLLQDLELAQVGLRDGTAPPDGVSEAARQAWDGLRAPTTPDALAEAIRISLSAALAALLELEVRGLVRSVGGRYERRVGDDDG